MNNKKYPFIQAEETQTTIDFEGLVKVKVISDPLVTEGSLYKKDQHFTPTATAAPMVSSLQAQLRPDLWEKDSFGLAHFRHEAKGKSSNYIEHYITSPDDISLLPWDEALQIVDKFGLTTAKLHLIFAAHSMRQQEPWLSFFTLSANDLITELGWDKRTDLTKNQKLNELAKAAFALGCLTIQATWVEGYRKNKITCSVETSRIWETAIKVKGSKLNLRGQINLKDQIDKLDEVYITVRPGLWTLGFLNRAGAEAKKALYQFGYLVQELLKIDPYHDDFALRLGLNLTLESRFHTSGIYKVLTILETLLPKTVINEALENRDKARKLINRWNHALEVLSGLTRAFQIEFDSVSYPEALRPGSKARKPRGYFEQLLAAKITILPPKPIPELLANKTKPQLNQPKSNPANQPKSSSESLKSELTGTEIQNARKAKGWNQVKLAGFLGVSQAFISQVEKGNRTFSKKMEAKVRKILNL
ncbi:MAG: helix-turn-helix transcriptional regulator [Prochloraceae cyanobacterium]|nr:helix-turn-helix transcriptional regulator [Prochloraceae cyanobacterium]